VEGHLVEGGRLNLEVEEEQEYLEVAEEVSYNCHWYIPP
jgi:hypothetical protein